TDSACTGVDLNIYQNKGDVYIDGGPAHKGFGTGLPDGSYCVQVTEPGANGAVLGTSAPGAVVVSGGEFVQNGQQGPCYQLSAILTKTSDGTPGYDTTSNPGNEYTVWISPVTDGGTCSFDPNRSKTDNFKVTGG